MKTWEGFIDSVDQLHEVDQLYEETTLCLVDVNIFDLLKYHYTGNMN